MKVTKAKAEEHRVALVKAAWNLFQERGFEGASVADISAEAKLSQGAFYGRFATKSALAAEACRASHSAGVESWKAVKGTTSNDASAYLRQYLQKDHVLDPAGGCPMAAYSAEVRRQDDEVQQAFTEGVVEMAELMRDALSARLAPEVSRRRSLLLVSAIAGSVAMARATAKTDPQLSAEIIEAARRELEVLTTLS
ncbi:TetR/AcrR family transcriptional regulator [Beijerinckia sp. L45]|uniref:TetR/AcrR family transcriptional regulator n=1 Tax=Beijerinckia sp. L45 TaxID=1641855 RepID=UPI00131C7981|nr:TetR/AcrR family transcriptional regulator [Beijerinckia sp. L45]